MDEACRLMGGSLPGLPAKMPGLSAVLGSPERCWSLGFPVSDVSRSPPPQSFSSPKEEHLPDKNTL